VPADAAGGAPRLSNPLNLRTAIKFAALYTVIAFAVKYVRANDLTASLLPLSFVSGLTDLDAITLSIARERGGSEGAGVPAIAVQAVVIAAIANTLLKTGLGVILGSPALRWRIAAVLVATALAGAGWVWFGR
jgi:uncharacterized membrane protein (DUF4010 family)